MRITFADFIFLFRYFCLCCSVFHLPFLFTIFCSFYSFGFFRCSYMYHCMFVLLFCIFRGFLRNSLFNKIRFTFALYGKALLPKYVISHVSFHYRFPFMCVFFSTWSCIYFSSYSVFLNRSFFFFIKGKIECMNGFIKGEMRTKCNGLLQYLGETERRKKSII